MKWDDLRYFLQVARHGSLTEASKRLKVSQSTVARRIEQLEDALDARVFIRHSTGYTLTEAGQELKSHAQGIEDSMHRLQQNMTGRNMALYGTVRIATTAALAIELLSPYLGEFQSRHPGICIEITTMLRTVNLTRQEADIALRLLKPHHGELTCKRLAQLRWSIYATDNYLKEAGYINAFSDMQNPKIIGWAEEYRYLPVAQFLTEQFPNVRPVIRSHDVRFQLQAARSGYGLAALPCFLGDQAPELKRLIAPSDTFSRALWMIMPTALRGNASLRAVVSWIEESVEKKAASLWG